MLCFGWKALGGSRGSRRLDGGRPGGGANCGAEELRFQVVGQSQWLMRRLPTHNLVTSCFPAAPAPVCVQGFESVADVSGQLARVATVDAWDGGDGEEVVEEEFDLADLMGDDESDEGAEL